MAVSFSLCHSLHSLPPDVLDGGAAVSFLRPHLQRVGEEEEELAVLHPDRQHLSVCAVAHTPGCVADTHLVQQFLQKEETNRMNPIFHLVIELINKYQSGQFGGRRTV